MITREHWEVTREHRRRVLVVLRHPRVTSRVRVRVRVTVRARVRVRLRVRFRVVGLRPQATSSSLGLG